MAHDGFFGGPDDLSWPLSHAAAAVAFDPAPHALMGTVAGWGHDAAVGVLVPSQPPSPSSLAVVGGGRGDAVEAALMEQIASRLGVSVPSPPSSSRYASCHSTPVGSPGSKPAAPCVLAGDAVLSCFRASAGIGNLSRVASSQSLLGDQAPVPCSDDGPCRKRKASGGKSKAKDVVTTAKPKSRETETRAKKCKLSTISTEAAHDEEQTPPAAAGEGWHGNGNGNGNGKGKELAVAEPPKDYIHVRARRGQATDSHSLAERVRREKIGERMKLLQDLVPGCSKVTGKAVMLDEIINYVQSLQRQVEFLSMKLSTVNPRLELDVDSFVPNKLCAPATTSMAHPLPPVYTFEGSSSAFGYTSSPGTPAQSVVTNAKGFERPSPIVNHGDANLSLEGLQDANPQMGSLWEEDDLQSLVLMGFRGNT